MNDIAIRVNNVTKLYKLYDKPTDRLKETFGLSKKKVYKEHYALHNLDFEVKKGECVGIIGTNGAGKSTILKIITGVLNPTEGEVDIDGRISALLELGAGFNMEYTGIENVYLNGTMIGFSREEIDEKLDDILTFADIGDFINQPVKTYSSGMFVRLAFAVAINIDPEILIVDEALSVGDVFFQAKCFKKFEEFKNNGKTILFVSHDLSSISKYCDRAILLNKGHKIAEGNPFDVIDTYKKVLVGQLDENNYSGTQKGINDITHNENAQEHWKDNYVINPDYQEYGDHLVDIVDFAVVDDDEVYTSTLIKNTFFTIKIKIRANSNAENPIVAFTIKDIKGTDITGTNTMYENSDIGRLNPGDERVITFRQNNNLQGGQYLLSLGCTRFENDDFQVYDRLYNICSISVISEKNTVGFYDMNSEVKII
ncbi:MAG: ABC transporter ATP-binding protein [Lachnospiraceae bacterium]|nr:ABC transporter ATP-binding protein [Lachnospiraceae bacterium]